MGDHPGRLRGTRSTNDDDRASNDADKPMLVVSAAAGSRPGRKHGYSSVRLILRCTFITMIGGLVCWSLLRCFDLSKTTSLEEPEEFVLREFHRPQQHKQQQQQQVVRYRKRDKIKYPRVIFFVHIHKSAGTLMCRLAHWNEAAVNMPHNCNAQPDQYCCGGKDTLIAQRRYAQRSRFDFVAIERDMYENMAPNSYDYVVSLRKSQSRYYSHWKYLRTLVPVGPGIQIGGFGDSSWLFGSNEILPAVGKKKILEEGEDPLGDFHVWYQGQPDNWNTRILCGAKCRPRPKYQITRKLFEYTLHRLERFAHILFVEDFETSYNRIAKAYQWQNYTSVISRNAPKNQSKGDNGNGEVRSNKLSADEKWDPLMSALDDALYEFARRIYNHTHKDELWRPFSNQEILDRYFAEGVKFACTDACCGKCSPY